MGYCFRAITRWETLATQARNESSWATVNEKNMAFTATPRQNRVTSWLKLNGRNARIRKIKIYCSIDVIYFFWNICKNKTQKKKTSVYILTSVLKKVCKRFSSSLRTQIYFEWIKIYNYCIRLSYDVKNCAVFGLQPRWITFYLIGIILHIIRSPV